MPGPKGAEHVEPKPDAGIVDENKESASVAAAPQKLENMVAGSEVNKACRKREDVGSLAGRWRKASLPRRD